MGNYCPTLCFKEIRYPKQSNQDSPNFQCSNPTAQRMVIQIVHKINDQIINSTKGLTSTSQCIVSLKRAQYTQSLIKNVSNQMNTMHTMNTMQSMKTDKKIFVSIKEGFQSECSEQIPKTKANPALFPEKERYPLLLKVRKEKRKTNILTPSNLFQYQYFFDSLCSTLFLFEGYPLQILSSLGQNRVILHKQSPIFVKLIIQCLKCENAVKITFSKANISLDQIYCQNCEMQAAWIVKSIDSNMQIWSNGEKINQNKLPFRASFQFRLMGCQSCLQFNHLKYLPCGCKTCTKCQQQVVSCKFCQEKSQSK